MLRNLLLFKRKSNSLSNIEYSYQINNPSIRFRWKDGYRWFKHFMEPDSDAITLWAREFGLLRWHWHGQGHCSRSKYYVSLQLFCQKLSKSFQSSKGVSSCPSGWVQIPFFLYVLNTYLHSLSRDPRGPCGSDSLRNVTASCRI